MVKSLYSKLLRALCADSDNSIVIGLDLYLEPIKCESDLMPNIGLDYGKD